jgi:hypothetical protein
VVWVWDLAWFLPLDGIKLFVRWAFESNETAAARQPPPPAVGGGLSVEAAAAFATAGAAAVELTQTHLPMPPIKEDAVGAVYSCYTQWVQTVLCANRSV